MQNQTHKIKGILLVVFFLSGSLCVAQKSHYYDFIKKLTLKLKSSAKVTIKANVKVYKGDNVIRSFTSELIKNEDDFYKDIDGLETFIVDGFYVLIDHNQKAVQYGATKFNNSEYLESNFSLGMIDSLSNDKNNEVKKITQRGDLHTYEIVNKNATIHRTTISFLEERLSVTEIVMYYSNSIKEADKVKIDYSKFSTGVADLSIFGKYFTVDRKKIVFNSTLKNYKKIKTD